MGGPGAPLSKRPSTLECLVCETDALRTVSQTRHSNVIVLFINCAPGTPTTLFILVRDSLHCSVTGVVHSVVRDLQFLCNFSLGIAFISQNKNRLTSFRRKLFVSGHFETVNEPTNADAPDSQLV